MVKDEQELRPTSRDTYTHFPDLLLRNDQSITNSRCSGSCTATLAKTCPWRVMAPSTVIRHVGEGFGDVE